MTWTPQQIARARAMYAEGARGPDIAYALRKHYSGGFHDVMRKYLGDLMPPKRAYRHQQDKPTHRVRHQRAVEAEREPEPERRPYDPLKDNPRMQRLLGDSR